VDGITFKRTERECLHNTNLRESGSSRGIIYDWQVHLNGEHIATWCQEKRRSYGLADAEGVPLGYANRRVLARCKGDFHRLVVANFDRIPTKEQLAERSRERCAREKAEEARVTYEQRRARLLRQSEAMFRVLKDFRLVIGDRAEEIIGKVERIRKGPKRV